MEDTQVLCTLHKTSYFVLTNHLASTDNCPYGDKWLPRDLTTRDAHTYMPGSGMRRRTLEYQDVSPGALRLTVMSGRAG